MKESTTSFCRSMELPKPSDRQAAAEEFAREAETRSPGLFREFWDFLITNKRWWLTPIVVVLLLFGLLVALAQTGLAPFIYPFF